MGLILLNLNNITDPSLIDCVNGCLKNSLLKDSLFVKVNCSLEEFSNLDFTYVDFIFVDCSSFSEESYKKFKNALFRNQRLVYLHNLDEFYPKYYDDLEYHGLLKFIVDKSKFLTSEGFVNCLDVIKDFYGEPSDKRRFSNSDFSINARLDNDWMFHVEDGSMESLEFSRDSFRQFEVKQLIKLDDKDYNSSFNPYLYNPWPFIIGCDDNEVVKFKLEVFDKIKNLKASDLLNVSLEVKDFILSRPYVGIDDIKSIVCKEGDLL